MVIHLEPNIILTGSRKLPCYLNSPSITQCPKCETIFWFDKTNEVGEMDVWGKSKDSQWKDVKRAEFLSIQGYYTAIKKKLYKSVKDELFLRFRLWWTFNARVRKGKPLFKNEHEETQWLKNVHGLLQLFDSKNLLIGKLLQIIYQEKYGKANTRR